jgi:hypothetical protein
MQVTKKRSEAATHTYRRVYGLCPPNSFALAEANKTLDKEADQCYTQFPNYKMNNSINS